MTRDKDAMGPSLKRMKFHSDNTSIPVTTSSTIIVPSLSVLPVSTSDSMMVSSTTSRSLDDDIVCQDTLTQSMEEEPIVISHLSDDSSSSQSHDHVTSSNCQEVHMDDTDTDPDPVTNADFDTNADSDVDANTNVDSDTSADSDANADVADTNAGNLDDSTSKLDPDISSISNDHCYAAQVNKLDSNYQEQQSSTEPTVSNVMHLGSETLMSSLEAQVEVEKQVSVLDLEAISLVKETNEMYQDEVISQDLFIVEETDPEEDGE